MRIAIIQFPGSNCESESIRAVRMTGMEAEEFLWNRNFCDLANFDGYFIVGGFSYEDRSRSGVIASLDPLMPYIRAEATKGKPVLGICNGAQILVETGLVPGLKNNAVGMALAENQRIQDKKVIGTGFYNSWVHMKMDIPSGNSAFTRNFKNGEIIKVPVAHGEGRFIIPPALLEEMIAKNLTAFRYCDEHGQTTTEFPINPNGATYNLAAVTNTAENVMAMMPHPERTLDGQPIFTSMRDYIADHSTLKIGSLKFEPPAMELTPYSPPLNSQELTVKLIISDNEAVSVEDALKKTGLDVKIERAVHWETVAKMKPTKNILKQIVASGELFNSNKEKQFTPTKEQNSIWLLVRNKEDSIGEQKKQALENREGIQLTTVKRGTLWKVTCACDNIHNVLPKILQTRIFANQFSQDCYIYMSDYQAIIKENLENCLTQTDLGQGKKKAGKVRDTYELKDKLILVTTDRQSAFDRVLAAIPFKGQVLNQTSAWWFEKTKHIVPNHVIAIPHPNVTIAKKCRVFPVEVVVRGFITGTTSTSAWVNYMSGVRNYCGNILPEGLKKNQRFDRAIVTPTTKSDEHDRLISPKEIVAEGLMTEAEWNYVSEKALELFAFGQKTAAAHGLILVDTKYEFGKDENGVVTLIDEIHTPDSSRYWIANSYEERMRQGLEPENIDKEFLRLWFKDHCDPYKDKELPPAPEELVVELSRRYIQLYEMITGENFVFPDAGLPVAEQIRKVLPQKTVLKAVLILGSKSDEEFAKKITDKLGEFEIPFDQHIASAHKEAKKCLEILEKYHKQPIVYITIAGRSNALSGFVAGNSNKPTIACPPFADKLDMLTNVQSTLQMPSNVPVMIVLDPGNAALAVKRIAEML